LLEFSSSDKFDKILVVFAESVINFVFGTGHPIMVKALAFETVVFAACGTTVIVQAFVELENSRASRCGAPGRCCVFLNELVKAEFLEFFF
jgi:hypothetical protein